MRICSASGSSACKQHLPSLEVEGDMEDIPHSYLIYIIHYVLIVKQATLQPETIRKELQQHTGFVFGKQCDCGGAVGKHIPFWKAPV